MTWLWISSADTHFALIRAFALNCTVPYRCEDGKKFFPYVHGGVKGGWGGMSAIFSSILKSSSHLTLNISLLSALNKL